MKKPVNKQAGFTLVEISLAMAIFTFMLLVVAMAYINIARLYNASTAARNVQQNNRFAMEQISRVARTAKSMEVSTSDSTGGLRSICFASTNGSELFYLHSLDANDIQKNELRQASVTSCSTPPSSFKTLSSASSNAARLQASTAPSGTVTISLWMVSKTDLLDSVSGSNLQCKSGVGAEFCAINKLTTTVELRGE